MPCNRPTQPAGTELSDWATFCLTDSAWVLLIATLQRSKRSWIPRRLRSSCIPRRLRSSCRLPLPEIQEQLDIAAEIDLESDAADLLRCWLAQGVFDFELSQSRHEAAPAGLVSVVGLQSAGVRVVDSAKEAAESVPRQVGSVSAGSRVSRMYICDYCDFNCSSTAGLKTHCIQHKESELRRDGTYVWENSDTWLCSDVILAANELHRAEFPRAGGLDDPVSPNSVRAVAAVAGPQIVNVGLNHWIVAVGCVRDPVVQVFDSSTSTSRTLSLGRAVSALYVLEDEYVAKRVVSVATPQQVGSHDCGLFAIAMQDRILRETQYDVPFDQSKMRKHLADCLRAKKMQPFPVDRYKFF